MSTSLVSTPQTAPLSAPPYSSPHTFLTLPLPQLLYPGSVLYLTTLHCTALPLQQVCSGMDILMAINSVPTDKDDRPKKPVQVLKITISA